MLQVSSFRFKAQSKNKIIDDREKIKVKNLLNYWKFELISFDFLATRRKSFRHVTPNSN